MQPLFVTSFATDMFQTTGIHLIGSFLTTGTEGRLLVCHERCPVDSLPRDERLICHDLSESTLLRTWLHDNRDIVPDYLGGEARECDCANGHGTKKVKHRPRCPFSWFNRNASRWFRKIASLSHALTVDYGDAIVWLDSDCRFLQALPSETIDRAFGSHAAFFLKGPHRPAVEAGVIGFRRNESGIALMNRVVERYVSGRFRDDERWDDGYQFQMVFAEESPALSVDIAIPSEQFERSFDSVLPKSMLGEFITHFKGIHGPVLRLMV